VGRRASTSVAGLQVIGQRGGVDEPVAAAFDGRDPAFVDLAAQGVCGEMAFLRGFRKGQVTLWRGQLLQRVTRDVMTRVEKFECDQPVRPVEVEMYAGGDLDGAWAATLRGQLNGERVRLDVVLDMHGCPPATRDGCDGSVEPHRRDDMDFVSVFDENDFRLRVSNTAATAPPLCTGHRQGCLTDPACQEPLHHWPRYPAFSELLQGMITIGDPLGSHEGNIHVCVYIGSGWLVDV
jgi:hypothetical protein